MTTEDKKLILETFTTLVYKPEHKDTFMSIVRTMMEYNKNIYIKAERFSGVMKALSSSSSSKGIKLYVYDFDDLETERWEDNLRNHFGMISRFEEFCVVIKNFENHCSLENVYDFLWSTNTFTDKSASFIILSEQTQMEGNYPKRSEQIRNEDFFYLLGNDDSFLGYSIDKMNNDKYNNKIDSSILLLEILENKSLIQF